MFTCHVLQLGFPRALRKIFQKVSWTIDWARGNPNHIKIFEIFLMVRGDPNYKKF